MPAREVEKLMEMAAAGGHFFRALGWQKSPGNDTVFRMIAAMPPCSDGEDTYNAVRAYIRMFPTGYDLVALYIHVQSGFSGYGPSANDVQVMEIVLGIATGDMGRGRFDSMVLERKAARSKQLARVSPNWEIDYCYECFRMPESWEMRAAATKRTRQIMRSRLRIHLPRLYPDL
jgi:hypothetical protein